MRVKSIKVNINREAMAQLDKAKQRALVLTAHAMLSDIVDRGVVPKRDGPLVDSGFVDEEHIDVELVASIVFDTPYARRWYFNLDGATFQKTQNVNAQDHWMDYYLDGEGRQWVVDTYCKFLQQESGGLIT